MIRKINILYYKNIVDLVLIDFIKRNGDKFGKDGGNYVMNKGMTVNKLAKILTTGAIKLMQECFKPWSAADQNTYYVICGCAPKDNLLYKYRDKHKYFPAKLDTIIQNGNIRWILKEHDIKLVAKIEDLSDAMILAFNALCKRFKKQNVKFLMHKSLDCYTIFKLLKSLYGTANCINMLKSLQLEDKLLPIVAVNDLILRYTHSKDVVSVSSEFKQAGAELRAFIQQI